MPDIKRWEHFGMSHVGPFGAYVLYEDHAAVVAGKDAEIALLRDTIATLAGDDHLSTPSGCLYGCPACNTKEPPHAE